MGENILKNQFLKVKDSLLKSEKNFIELKYREVKIQKEIEELCFNPTSVSIDDGLVWKKKKWRK